MGVLVDGTTFLVTDEAGDVAAAGGADPHGLFHDDTRLLSRWSLRVDGETVTPLARVVDGFRAGTVTAVARRGEHGAGLVVRRRQLVVAGVGLREELTLTSYDGSRDVVVDVAVDADFADIFEVRGFARVERAPVRAAADGALSFSYAAGEFSAAVAVRCDRPFEVTDDGVRMVLGVVAGRPTTVVLTVAVDGGARAPAYDEAVAADEADLRRWADGVAGLRAADATRAATLRQSLRDLRALCFTSPLAPDAGRVPAAGLPWFVTLFGRDSLLTSYLSLRALPDLARGTLRALAATQGRVDDAAREEQPGKVVHECRAGELSRSGTVPFGRYYGTVDATPLFVVLLEAYVGVTGDVALARELEPAARAALGWLAGPGDVDGDGFIEYARRNPRGLANQCWKDSPDSMRFADGSIATGPIAVCEAQGYAYDARRRGARLARSVWGDDAYADSLDRAADALAGAFDAAFWDDGRGCYALALDGAKRRVDSRASNIGHLLWSGIVPAHRVDAVADALMSPELFSGWGVRTLAADEVAYNPVSYHRGSVWPHDSAIVAAGLARAGRAADAATVADAVLAAAPAFDHRLPELMAGFARAATGRPVGYPTACSPQAWAAAAPLLLLAIEDGAGVP